MNRIQVLRPYAMTVLSGLLVTALCSQPRGGIMVLFFALPFIPWLIYSLVLIVRKPARRKSQAIRVVLWLAVFAMIGGVIHHHAAATRRAADEVLARIHSHRAAHGRWPESLVEIGLKPQDYRQEWGLGYDMKEDKTPLLYYRSAFNGYDIYRYDFSSDQWQLILD